MRSPLVPTVLWPVVEESFDEAEFLWRSWESSLDTHARNYREVWFWTEDRLGGALDGVRLGQGKACEELLAPALRQGHNEHAFVVAAHVLASTSAGVAWEILQPHLCTAKGQIGRLCGRALELATSSPQVRALEENLHRMGAAGLPWLVAARTFRRQQSAPADVYDLATSHSADHRRVAMAAARLLRPHVARQLIEPGLSDIDAHVVAAATESGLVHGLRSAWARCLELGAAQTVPSSFFWLSALGAERESRLLMAALAQPRSFELGLAALGFLGTKEAANVALQAMQNETHARLAAEAFCAITGLILPANNLVAPEPAGVDELIPYELDDMNADLVPKLDDLLPLPDAAGVQRWWAQHEAHFDPHTRYIGGRPLCPEALHQALASGPMRRRHVLAFELAVRTGGACDLQTRAFYSLQRQQLNAIAEHICSDALPFSIQQPGLA